MFDFRYHVASLAAVFIALVVGIVIGVGLSGEPLERSERVRLNDALDKSDREIERLRERLEERAASDELVAAAYPTIMENRLAGKRVAVLFIGKADGELRSAVTSAIADADGSVARFKSLRLAVDTDRIAEAAEDDDLRDVGETLGREFVAAGEMPLWDALASELVFQQEPGNEPADGVVVVRTVEPQGGETARFLSGLYAGLAGDVPTIWIAPGDETPMRPPRGMTVVESVTTPLGKIRLAVLLSGENPDEPIQPAQAPLDSSG